jgi:hypothetical protein
MELDLLLFLVILPFVIGLGWWIWRLATGRSKFNGLLTSAVILLLVSVGAIVGGVYYRQNHPWEGVAGLFGDGSSPYAVAGWALGLGVLVFLVSIGMLVAGLVRPKRVAPSSTKKCPDCAETIQAEAKVCRFCGKALQTTPSS